MTFPLPRRALGFAVAAFAMATAAGCSSTGSHAKTSDYGSLPTPGVRARVSTLQLVLDTGQPTDQPIGPDMVVNGIVVYNAGFEAWFAAGGNGMLSSSSRTSLYDEADKAQSFIDQVPKKITASSAAHAVIASELLDAGLLTSSDLPGALDADDKVSAGPGVESWYAAHAGQPLAKGASVTLSAEADRITAEINKPE